MRTKVRVLANIYVEDRLDDKPFQFSRDIPVYRYHVIRAFIKNCPLIKKATEEDFQTIIVITIVCSNDKNAMTILNGLEGCAKNSFFDKLTRKQVAEEIKKYVHWYNNERIQKKLGYLSPVEYRLKYS